MKYLRLIILCFVLNIISAQAPTITVEGSHTITQSDGMDIYQAIDLCLKQAIINGVFDYLIDENDFTDEKKAEIMEMLIPAVEMCVMEPTIIEQSINDNTIFIRAGAEVDPMILNSILGIE